MWGRRLSPTPSSVVCSESRFRFGCASAHAGLRVKCARKGCAMRMPKSIGAFVWGTVSGAIVLAVVGFTWLGWVTGGTAAVDAAAAARDAKVAALAPICAERFRRQADASTQIASLNTAKSWERDSVIERSGFATMAGSKSPDSDVARACAEILLTKSPPPKG